MKKILPLLLILILASCTEPQHYTFDWDLTRMKEYQARLDSVQLIVDGEVVQRTTDLKNYKIHFEGTVPEPSIASVRLYTTAFEMKDSITAEVILEEGNIVYNTDLACAEGSASNDSLVAVYKTLIDESNKEDFTFEKAKGIIYDFITSHSSDICSVFMLNNADFISVLEPQEQSKLYDSLSSKMKNQYMAKEYKKKLDIIFNSTPGHKFIDFEAEYNGKIQRLSDYVGKGKPCLVDFWASWCGPCREEIPNIIDVFFDYEDEINVLGVASWDEPENTLRAMEELGIEYPQIMNAQAVGTDAYSIEGIPEIILFSADGTILKRGLRGEEIMKAVKEVLKKK